jgi:hypothetical protein
MTSFFTKFLLVKNLMVADSTFSFKNIIADDR